MFASSREIRILLKAILLFCMSASVFAAGHEDASLAFCRPDLIRIESAYEAGLKKSSAAENVQLCLRLRNEALSELVERTYESTLAWFAGRDGELEALQADQAQWQRRRDALMLPSRWVVSGDIEAQTRAGEMMLERLRRFGEMSGMSSPC